MRPQTVAALFEALTIYRASKEALLEIPWPAIARLQLFAQLDAAYEQISTLLLEEMNTALAVAGIKDEHEVWLAMSALADAILDRFEEAPDPGFAIPSSCPDCGLDHLALAEAEEQRRREEAVTVFARLAAQVPEELN